MPAAGVTVARAGAVDDRPGAACGLSPALTHRAWLLAGAPVAAVVLALALAAIPLRARRRRPRGRLRQMAVASLGSWFALSETLTRATPLILTGLAVAVAFRARLWNIGAEGQLYLGAVTAVALGSGAVHAPPIVLLPLVLAAGAAAGALFMLGPTWLKLRLRGRRGGDHAAAELRGAAVRRHDAGRPDAGSDEPGLAAVGADHRRRHPAPAGGQDPGPCRPGRGARRRRCCVWLYLERTTWGFETQAVGSNARAAGYAGMPVARVLLRGA